MAIIYKKVVRLSDPTDKTSAKKAYPAITYRYGVPATIKEFAKEIYLSSGVSEGDVYSVLKDFRSALQKALMSGRYVNIEGLGCFYLSLQSKGTEKPEDFTHAHIEGLRICFRASNDIRLHNGTGGTRTGGLAFKDLDRITDSSGTEEEDTPTPIDPEDETPIVPET